MWEHKRGLFCRRLVQRFVHSLFVFFVVGVVIDVCVIRCCSLASCHALFFRATALLLDLIQKLLLVGVRVGNARVGLAARLPLWISLRLAALLAVVLSHLFIHLFTLLDREALGRALLDPHHGVVAGCTGPCRATFFYERHVVPSVRIPATWPAWWTDWWPSSARRAGATSSSRHVAACMWH